MSPCRSCTLCRPLWSTRERASASIAALWSTPTARPASGAASSSIRPVPVPRSSRARIGPAPIIAITAASTRSSGACSARMVSQSAARCGEIGGGLAPAGLAASSPGGRGRRPASGSAGSRRASRSRASAAGAARNCSASRKNAHAPSRWRSARPASTSSLRWRDTRGCDWPRMATSSLTVSSAWPIRRAGAAGSSRPPPRGPPAGFPPPPDRRKWSNRLDINIYLCLYLS